MTGKNICENKCFSTIDKNLRSFQIRLNLQSLATNVQLTDFGIIDSELCSFCLEQPETLIHFFLVNMLIASEMIFEIRLLKNYMSTLNYLRFIDYLVFKKIY